MYGKIFASMFKGSLYGQWEAIVTFTVMIVLADQEGEVDMTPEALAAATSIPLEIILRGIAALEQPDPKSRTPDEEGRRIVRVSDTRDWGWTITNYAHYRAIRSAEERREYMKLYQRKRRASGKPASTEESTPVSEVSQSSKQEAVSRKQKDELRTTHAARATAAHEERFAHPDHLLAYQALRSVGGVAVDGGLRAVTQSMTGNRTTYPWDVVGAALVEMAANGVKFSVEGCRAYCRRLLTPDAPTTARNSRANHDATDAAIAEGVRRLNAAGVNGGE